MPKTASYVYGPVPSRRLGQSLGVDPIPFKTCNYNCVYCQLGRTRPLICERGDYFPADEIIEQVRKALTAHRPGEIGYVTLVGQGEPTLCASLGNIIRGIADMTDIPIAVITNGALLACAQVRAELSAADVVMPSLDAGDQPTFRKVNRPCPRLRIDEIIEGMTSFQRAFSGQLWIEVMLVKGLNDSDESLWSLHKALATIQPDHIQINLPVRPPAEPWVKIPDEEVVRRAAEILGEAAEVVTPYMGQFDLDQDRDLINAVLAIIRRHPMREVRLIETLARYAPQRVRDTLIDLEKSGQARRRIYRNESFWESTQVRVGHSAPK